MIFEVSDDVLMTLMMMILMMTKNSVLGVKKGVFLRGQKRGVFGVPKSCFWGRWRVEELYDVKWWVKLMMKWCNNDVMMKRWWCKRDVRRRKKLKKGSFLRPPKRGLFWPFFEGPGNGLKWRVTVSSYNFEQREQLGRNTTSVRSEARDARVLKPSRRATPISSDRNGVTATRQRHGRHGCDAGVLMPLDEKLFRLRKSSRRSCRDWSLRNEVNRCVVWGNKRSAMRRSDLDRTHQKIFFDVLMHRTRSVTAKNFMTLWRHIELATRFDLSLWHRSQIDLIKKTFWSLSWSVSILMHRSWSPKRTGSRNETRKREAIKLRTSNFVDEVIMKTRDATESDQRSDVMRSKLKT